MLQSKARAQIPESVLDMLRRPEHGNISFELEQDDILALNLVRWFKESCMRWIDPITCPECSAETQFESTVTGGELNEEDRKYGSGRVEMHRCKANPSHPIRRFPRYK